MRFPSDVTSTCNCSAEKSEPDESEHARDERCQQDCHFRSIDGFNIASKRQIGDEDRHRKADAAQKTCSAYATPIEIVRQPAQTRGHGNEAQQSNAQWLTQYQPSN